MTLEEFRAEGRYYFTQLVDKKLDFLVINGQLVASEDINIFPGSFNPIHEGHRHTFDEIKRKYPFPSYLEISICNKDKGLIDYPTLLSRLENIHVPIIVTNSPKMLDKAVIFPHATFHVGSDTMERILRDDPLEKLSSIKRLVIWPRNGISFVNKFVFPSNLEEVSDYVSRDISSSEIRKFSGPKAYPTVDVGIYNNKTDEVILGRKKNDPPDKFRFIGGFVDPSDANFEAAAIRELREETGICSYDTNNPIQGFSPLGSFKINDPRLTDGDGIITSLFFLELWETPVDMKAGDDIVELRSFPLYEFYGALLDHHKEIGRILFKKILSTKQKPC